MSSRANGKAERAYYIACDDMMQILIKAMEAGADSDDLLHFIYNFITHKTGHRLPATARKESAFELRPKNMPRSGEMPAQGAPLADRALYQGNTCENPGRSTGPVQAANSRQEGNRLCLESYRRKAAAAILDSLFGTSDPAKGECAAVKQLFEHALQTVPHSCIQSDSCGLPLEAMRQEACRGCPQTSQSFRKCKNFGFPCFILQSIVSMIWDKEQGAGGAE